MSKLIAALVLCLSPLVLADTAGTPPPPAKKPATCFQLSPDGKAWSRTPELLCVGAGTKQVEITMTTGRPPATEVATFHFDLKNRARCIDCNQDEFALTNPSNSVFNALTIKFDGKRDPKRGTEAGRVSVGKTQLYYRLARR